MSRIGESGKALQSALYALSLLFCSKPLGFGVSKYNEAILHLLFESGMK